MDEGPKRIRSKWLDDRASRSRETKVQETRIAKELGGRRIPRSGASTWSPFMQKTDGADITTPTLHVEHKRTEKSSISLKHEWLEKVVEAARLRGKTPAMVITFTNAPVRLDWSKEDRVPMDWVLLPLDAITGILDLGDED